MDTELVMVRCPAVLRGSGFALAPQDDGRASNHAPLPTPRSYAALAKLRLVSAKA